MAISKEDKHDVKTHMGKALANKIEDATRDYSGKLRKNDYGGAAHNRKAQKLRDANPKAFADRERRMRAENDRNEGRVVKLRPVSSSGSGLDKGGMTTTMKPHYRDSDVRKMAGDKDRVKESREYEARASRRYGTNPYQVSSYGKKQILDNYRKKDSERL
jgi:hypothetical protein